MTKLTIKQDTFVLAYLETGNATEAYRRAYNVGKMKVATISNNAYKLLNEPTIKQRIDSSREATFNAATIDRAGVLRAMVEIATANAADLSEVQVRCCRHCWGVGHRFQWKNETEFGFRLAEVLDQTAADLSQWQRDVDLGSKRPKPDPPPMPDDKGGYGFDVFAGPNPECPECLGEGKTHAVFKDTRKLRGAARRLYAGVKQTKDGMQIMTRDQDKMLELLAKEFGIGKEPVAPPTVNVGVQVAAENVTIAVDAQDAARQYLELMKGA